MIFRQIGLAVLIRPLRSAEWIFICWLNLYRSISSVPTNQIKNKYWINLIFICFPRGELAYCACWRGQYPLLFAGTCCTSSTTQHCCCRPFFPTKLLTMRCKVPYLISLTFYFWFELHNISSSLQLFQNILFLWTFPRFTWKVYCLV